MSTAPPDPPAADAAPGRVATAPGVLLKHWGDEETAVVFSAATASTHLVSRDAAALLQAAAAAALAADSADPDTIEALLQSGLLQRTG